MRTRHALTLVAALVMIACAGPNEPSSGVPAGVVATTTSVIGTITDYVDGASNATYTFGYLTMNTGHVSWSPFGLSTTLAADGSFAVELPSSPPLPAAGFGLPLCGQANEGDTLLGALVTHAGPSDGVSESDVTGFYLRARYPDDANGAFVFQNGVVVVLQWFADQDRDLRCVQDGAAAFTDAEGRFDVDVRLRGGWNVVTFTTRRSGDSTTTYVRTGDPGSDVGWVDVRDEL